MSRPRSLDDTPLYGRIASEFADAIRDARMRPGDKLPSLRRLGRERGVSLATVQQAYVVLEREGFIEARERSGYFVATPRRSGPAPRPVEQVTIGPVTIGALIQTVLESSSDPAVVPLGATTPSVDRLPYQALGRIAARLGRHHPEGLAAYAFGRGTPELRRQLSCDALSYGWEVSPDDFVTTSGALDALNLCLRAVAAPGDVVGIESPTFFGILQMIESLGMRAVELPTDPVDGIVLEELERAILAHGIKACVLIPNFQNPLGTSLSDLKKQGLVAMLARLKVALIEDDIYGDLPFAGKRPRPCKAFDVHGGVLLCASASKTVGPGLRIGWCAPGRYVDRVLALKSATSLSAPVMSERILAAFIEEGGYRRHLRAIRRTLSEQARMVERTVLEAFPEGTYVTQPSGGYALWVAMPEGLDAMRLYRTALEAGVCFMPGPVFSASGRFENCLRLGLGTSWSPAVEAGLRTVGRLARAMQKE